MAIVRKRRKLVILVAVGVVAATWLALSWLPTLYSASSAIVLDSRKNAVADQSAVLAALPTDPASVQNQIQVLTSRGLASRVIEKLQLWRDPEFNRALAPSLFDLLSGSLWRDGAAEREHDAIISAFLRRLSGDAQGLSTTITITFASRSPEKAARIANAVAETYIADQVNAKAQAASHASEWLSDRIQQLSEQAQAAEAAVEQYKKDNHLNEAADGTPLVDQELAALSTQLVQTKSDLAQKQATYDRVNALVKVGRGADIGQVVGSPLIVQLRTQQAELARQEAQMATRYGAMHPKMIDIQSQKQNLDDKIAQEVSRIASAVADDVAIARAQVKSMEKGLDQTAGQATGQSMTRVKLKALEVNAVSTRAMYESFVTRLRETQNQEAIQMADAHIISRALVPVAPSSPHRTLILLASVPVGLLLGLFLALLMERFAPAFGRSPVALFRGLPVLGQVPDSMRARAADQITDQPNSGFAQALDNLALTIASSPAGRGAHVIAVTSAQHGEGKTAIAAGLARAAARRGLRTVILDTDLHWPAVAGTIGFASVPRSVVDVLTGTAPLSHALFKDPKSSALALPAVRQPRNSSRLLSSQTMAQLIEHLRQTCDLVIIDAPPVLATHEARFIAPLADAVMLVVRWDRVTRGTIDHAIGALAAMRSPPAGIVIAA
jgi:capsular exopolysaccharide synthesis family protein